MSLHQSFELAEENEPFDMHYEFKRSSVFAVEPH